MRTIASRITDCHCHIYPSEIAMKAIYSIDRFYGGLPGRWQDGTIETLKKSGREQGITHFVVHSVATRPDQVPHINRFLAATVKEAGGLFTGLGTLHPGCADLAGDLEKLCASGLSGVKLHPDIQKFYVNETNAMRIFELCEEKGLPVLVHTGDYRYDYSNPNRTVQVLKHFPKLKLIGAHLGGWSVWDDAVRTLADFPNFTVDTSSSFFWLSEERAKEIIRIYGSERVMFGTDYPMWEQKKELDFLERLALDREEYENICWRTCARMFSVTKQE